MSLTIPNRAWLFTGLITSVLLSSWSFLPKSFREFIQPTAHAAATFNVNTADDHDDGVCNLADCTLREAINAANASIGTTDTISFTISGAGVHTINLSAGLPVITDPVIIDGTTQTGFSGTPLIELNGNGVPAFIQGLLFKGSSSGSTVKALIINRFGYRGIETDGGITVQGCYIGTNAAGSAAQGNIDGILLNGGGNQIGGPTAAARNIISGNSGSAIHICPFGCIPSGGNTIQGNYIGTDVTGTSAIANGAGIFIESPNNLIGGTTAGAGNLISGNTLYGVTTDAAPNANNNTIQGNFVGTNAAGTSAIPNTQAGIMIQSNSNTIGGPTASARNVISGNKDLAGLVLAGSQNNVQGNFIGTNAAGTSAVSNFNGIDVSGGGNIIGGTTAAARNIISGNTATNVLIRTSGNTVQGNFIGTKVDGSSSASNNGRGIYILIGAANNSIGGTTPGAGNVIAFNTQGGVMIDSNAGTGNAILGNSIYANTGGLGIDLKLDGVTANDACDPDTGPNNLQNFPVITSVIPGATTTNIIGTLNSTASTQFRLEFFSSASCDSSGNGQGQTYLGATNVTTNGACAATFSVMVSNASITGPDITVTATDPNNNTSEFSACVLDPTLTPKTLQFSSANFSVNEGDGHATISVTRAGDTSASATVNYSTADTDNFTVSCAAKQGQAFGRCDFTTVVGTLNWPAGDATPKTFQVPITDDSWAEGDETFSVVLTNPTGGSLGSPATATVTIHDNETVDGPNPILQTSPAGVDFFVRQHYLDFLGREPEPGQPWSVILNQCPNQFNTDPNSPSAQCDRIQVSGSFFGSPEFKDKGIYVIDFYRVAFDRLPAYSEFVFDSASVTGATQQDVFAKLAAYANNFVLRPEFTNAYGAMTNSQYVNALMSHNGHYNLTSITTRDPANPDTGNQVTLTINDLINGLNGSTLTRAQVLRAIVQSNEVTQNLEAKNAFVASQYYGYLRRTPDQPGFTGWVNYLTASPNDFRTMVHGFLDSTEYRMRFGPAQ